jgi:hypothetical protein
MMPTNAQHRLFASRAERPFAVFYEHKGMGTSHLGERFADADDARAFIDNKIKNVREGHTLTVIDTRTQSRGYSKSN